MAPPPTLADQFRFNAKMAELSYERASASYRYLIDRRDRMMDRMRLGAFSINAATLLGTISILGSDKSVRLAEVIDPVEPMLLLFILGVLTAGLSLMIAHRRFHEDAGDAATELHDLRRLSARLASDADDRNAIDLGKDLDSLKEHKVPEFSYSGSEFVFLSISNACWVAALSIPIWNLARTLDWTRTWPF